jgi:hypothetical protein
MVNGCGRDKPVAVVTSQIECNIAGEAHTRRRLLNDDVNVVIDKRMREIA